MTTNGLLEAAERVVRARTELAAAEAAFEALAGRGAAGTPSPSKPTAPQGGVAQAVRAALQRRPGGLLFGQLVEAVGGNPVAVRSAVKKERQRGHVRFQGGLYSWSAVKHNVKARAPRRVQAQQRVTAAPVGKAAGGKGGRRRVRKGPGGDGAAVAAAPQQGGQ